MKSQPAAVRVVQGLKAEGMSWAVQSLLCSRGLDAVPEVALMRPALVAATKAGTSAATLRTSTSLSPVGHATRLSSLRRGASSPDKRYLEGANPDYFRGHILQSRYLSSNDLMDIKYSIVTRHTCTLCSRRTCHPHSCLFR